MGYLFRLEALKRYRHFQEDTCQKNFSEAQRLYEREVQALSDLVALRNKTEAAMGKEKDKETSGPQMSVYSRYLERLARQITAQHLALNKAREICEDKRQGLIAAMQKRKTLEKLKERGLKTYLQNLNHEEEKFISEMAINRYILNSK